MNSNPGSGRSPGEGNGNAPQYSCLENTMDRGAGRLQFMWSQRVRDNLASKTNDKKEEEEVWFLCPHCEQL